MLGVGLVYQLQISPFQSVDLSCQHLAMVQKKKRDKKKSFATKDEEEAAVTLCQSRTVTRRITGPELRSVSPGKVKRAG